MFSSLRQDSLIYVLNKKNTPSLSIGRVVSVSSPVPKYPTTFTTPNIGIETTVDITVCIDGNNVDFRKVPSSLSIYGDNGIVISESKDAMNSEIEAMKTSSENIINSIDYHKNVVEECDIMLASLNPNLAKEKEQEDRITRIEDALSELTKVVSTVIKGKE